MKTTQRTTAQRIDLTLANGRTAVISRTGPEKPWVCRVRGTTFYYHNLAMMKAAVRNAAA